MTTTTQSLTLSRFNRLPREEAAAVLRPCLAIDRWINQVVDGRPYASPEALLEAGRRAAHPFTGPELEQALSAHPRIGERAAGTSAEAELSRAEQARLGLDDAVAARLADGNRAYEQRFGRVFLIRAAGRSPAEILDQLERRLTHDPDTEEAVVADQLRQIALVRLAGAVAP